MWMKKGGLIASLSTLHSRGMGTMCGSTLLFADAGGYESVLKCPTIQTFPLVKVARNGPMDSTKTISLFTLGAWQTVGQPGQEREKGSNDEV
jgi:hypothetical protein